MKKIVFAVIAAGFMMTGCQKYGKYDNMEVVENSYAGSVMITSTGSDPAGDFTGENESGIYSFVWDNSSEKAQLNFDVTTSSGSVQFKVYDSKGEEVLSETRSAGAGEDTFSGVSAAGKKGNWLIEIIITDFNGDGSFSISPA